MNLSGNKRAYVDCQYIPSIDACIINEVLNGKRNYLVMRDKFEFYISDEEEESLVPVFYKNVNELRKISCNYKDKYITIAKELNKKINLNDYNAKRNLEKNHRLFGSDISYEHFIIKKYYSKYADEIDESIPIKYMFFDIEVHNDFIPIVADELVRIKKWLEETKDKQGYYQKKIPIKIKKKFYKGHSYILDLDKNKLGSLILGTDDESLEIQYKNYTRYLFIVRNPNLTIKMKNYLLQVFDDELDMYDSKIGFPVEIEANNRIDAISYYDNIENIAYLNILSIKEESKVDLHDKKNIANDLKRFIHLFNLDVICNNSLSSFIKELKEKLSDSENKSTYTKEELLEKINSLEKIKTIISDTYYERRELSNEKLKDIFDYLEENFDSDIREKVKSKLVYKVFDTEIELIEDFMNCARLEIQPNIMIAHNAKFDILTLFNRIRKLRDNETAHRLFNHYIGNGLSIEEYIEDLQVKFEVDENPKSTKANRTIFYAPGVVINDSMLLFAKTQQKEKDFSLAVLTAQELKASKVNYTGSIFDFYFNDTIRFSKYSVVDTMLIGKLEEKLKFIMLFQNILRQSKSPWKMHATKTRFLANLIKYKTELKGFICKNNVVRFVDKDVDNDEVGYEGAYNTDLAKVKTYGLHDLAFDLDYSGFYPSAIIGTHIFPDSYRYTVKDKEMFEKFLYGDIIDFCNEYINTSDKQEIYELL